MDIQKEKNTYLGELLVRDAVTQDEFKDIVFKPEINAFHSNYLSSRFIDNINWGWNSWQAAKAQAVPEGFVLVPKEPSEQLLSKAIRKYLQVSDLSIITSRMAHLYELMIQEAMIEAQEQKG